MLPLPEKYKIKINTFLGHSCLFMCFASLPAHMNYFFIHIVEYRHYIANFKITFSHVKVNMKLKFEYFDFWSFNTLVIA